MYADSERIEKTEKGYIRGIGVNPWPMACDITYGTSAAIDARLAPRPNWIVMEKLRIGILLGGRSGEHEVSLLSAASVLNAIDKDKHAVVPIGITKEGRWLTRAPGRSTLRQEQAIPLGKHATDLEFREGFEILFVTAGNCIFLAAFKAETVLSGRVWLDLYHKRGIHQRRTIDSNESVWFELFCHHRD